MSDESLGANRASSKIGLIRVGIGLAQGLALYGLRWAVTGTHVWPATQPTLFATLLLVAAFLPPILLAGLGAMRTRTLAIWVAAAVALVVALTAYDVWRDAAAGEFLPMSLGLVGIAIAAFLFIADHLIAPADAERRLIASHAAYFDTTWKHVVQIGLSGAFVGAFWAVFMLGAALFDMVGLKFLAQLAAKYWFSIPVTFTMLAAAVHITDVRAGLTRGFRTVGLVLLSWLMPLMALLTAAFLVALLFTGLKPIWAYIGSSGMLLGAAAMLVVLINAAYQDGQLDTRPPLLLRWAARGAALLISPLVILAAVGLFLRIGQHGLTADRIVAFACFVVAACYAVGAAIAAVLPGPWMKPLERTNVYTAFVTLAVILALFTPIADPARISVGDQVSRLEHGKIAPDKFDYEFLRFKSGRYGRDALARLAVKTSGPNAPVIAQKARNALLETGPSRAGGLYTPPPSTPVTKIVAYPKGAVLPDSFLKQSWPNGSPCFEGARLCEAYLVSLGGDGKPEVVVNTGNEAVIYQQGDDKTWRQIGWLQGQCSGFREAMQRGDFKAATPTWNDLVVAGKRYRINPDLDCP